MKFEYWPKKFKLGKEVEVGIGGLKLFIPKKYLDWGVSFLFIRNRVLLFYSLSKKHKSWCNKKIFSFLFVR